MPPCPDPHSLAAPIAAGTQTAGETYSRIGEVEVTLHDGTTVTCLSLEGSGRGGLDCDWAGLSRSPETAAAGGAEGIP